jgi:hypothetical protein
MMLSINALSVSTTALKAVIPSSRAVGQSEGESGADAMSLPVVDNRDGQLGNTVIDRRPDVACDSDPVAARGVDGDEGFVVMVVDVGEVAQLGVGQARMRRQKPPVARALAETVEPCLQSRPVLGTHRPDFDRIRARWRRRMEPVAVGRRHARARSRLAPLPPA